jgi:hypothetical protein
MRLRQASRAGSPICDTPSTSPKRLTGRGRVPRRWPVECTVSTQVETNRTTLKPSPNPVEERLWFCRGVEPLAARLEEIDWLGAGSPWGCPGCGYMYRPGRFVESAKVLPFRDVSIEEIAHGDLKVPQIA